MNLRECVRTPFQDRDPQWGEAAGSGIKTEQERHKGVEGLKVGEGNTARRVHKVAVKFLNTTKNNRRGSSVKSEKLSGTQSHS